MFSQRMNLTLPLIILEWSMIITSILAQVYTLPQPLFEQLQPKGLKISIPGKTRLRDFPVSPQALLYLSPQTNIRGDEESGIYFIIVSARDIVIISGSPSMDTPGLQLFAFHGNINKEISSPKPGEISGDVYRAKNGRWTLKKPNVELRKGDVIHYWIYAQVNGAPYFKDNQRYNTATISSQQVESTTPMTSAKAETNRLIFSEDFNTLDKSIWSQDIKIPLDPDYEFCVYHTDNHAHLIEVDEGILRIKPIILEDTYGENATMYGTLQLADCTSTVPEECSRHAKSYSILPPVISARLNTKDRFSFKYGKIEIRAKFPEGDWLYPELWLNPRYSLYGPKYASGRVLLGFARGNDNLVDAQNFSRIFDARKLEFGIRSGSPTVNEESVLKIKDRDTQWNKDFHVYTTIWTADGFKFLADGEEIGRLLPTASGWLHNTNVNGMTAIAPFDQEFYISIGLGVGGVRVFPDNMISSGYEKPWKNVAAKAMLHFWHSKNQWLSSWRKENGRKTALEIDYIKVWSV